MPEALKLRKWGNSSAVRLPKEMLKKVGIAPDDSEVLVSVNTDSIVIKPKKKEKLLDKLFKNYDSNQPYPYEIVDKGGVVGEELY